MQNLKITIAYDGTHYLGWQKTPMGPSIEAALEKVLHQIFQKNITLQAASRTDAGVHARGQVVQFFVPQETSISQLQTSLNCLLPKDIVVLSMTAAKPDFHPTLDCTAKEYHYYICYGSVQLPPLRLYSWHYRYPLDLCAMKEAASALIGQHDFSAFCNTRKQMHYDHYVRHVHAIDMIDLGENRLMIKVTGNSFLYKMVRNLVGTLVYVGCGKIQANAVQEILMSKKRPQAGITAPAHGLSLEKVLYMQ